MILICLAALLILNPYTIIGPLGYYVALPFFGLAVAFGVRDIGKSIFYCFLVLMLVSFIGFFLQCCME